LLRTAAVASRVALGVVLLVAALGKLADDPSTRVSATVFLELDGPAAALAGAVERTLAKLELVVALAVLSGVGVLVASFASILLAVSFLAVSQSLPAGARCTCFGVFGGSSPGGVVHTSIGALILVCGVISLVEVLVRRMKSQRRAPTGDELAAA